MILLDVVLPVWVTPTPGSDVCFRNQEELTWESLASVKGVLWPYVELGMVVGWVLVDNTLQGLVVSPVVCCHWRHIK